MLIKKAFKTVRKGRVLLHFLKDPDTPVMVEIENKGTASYDCAVNCGDCDGYYLTDAEVNWLSGQRNEVEIWYDQHKGV